MALFFDQLWFDSRLAAAGKTRDDAALILGLGRAALEEIWKDQREVTASHVRALARLLQASEEEVARRAGVSTPLPGPGDLAARLDRIERLIYELKALVLDLRRPG